MRNKDKKMLYLGLFILIVCLIAGLSLSLYMIIPRDELNVDVKDYYVKQAIIYFNEENKNLVSVSSLIKSGYATSKKEFNDYGCKLNTSYINKEDNIIVFHTDCKKYTKDYKIKEG